MVKAVGPTGQLGRPGWSAGLPEAPTTPNFLWWDVLGCLVWSTLVLVCLEWVCDGSWATLGPIEPELVL